jgi:hypothetical protein
MEGDPLQVATGIRPVDAGLPVHIQINESRVNLAETAFLHTVFE